MATAAFCAGGSAQRFTESRSSALLLQCLRFTKLHRLFAQLDVFARGNQRPAGAKDDLRFPNLIAALPPFEVQRVELSDIESSLVDGTFKGIPGGVEPFPLREIGNKKWNVLRCDLPLPLAILKQSALAHNSRWMKRFLSLSGAKLCPHGKTTMSPQLFQQQLDDGAWGITLATIGQVQVARRFKTQRIFLANQLVGRAAIEYIAREISRDPDFDFYCLIDSVAGVQMLAEAMCRLQAPRPLQVLVEIGIPGKRCGCRDVESTLAVARAAAAHPNELHLCGVEGFEGVIADKDPAVAEKRVREYLAQLVEAARRGLEERLFRAERLILSAGGSQYYDLVVDELAATGIQANIELIVRSGCYLTHDSLIFCRIFDELLARSEDARQLGEGPRAALEVWSYVLSRPEPTRAVLTLGKRDCSFDVEMPAPLHWSRPGQKGPPIPMPPGHQIVALNDQHALLDLPADSPLQVGDMIAVGISHPCTTFDKWQLIPVVDDDYNITNAVRTYF